MCALLTAARRVLTSRALPGQILAVASAVASVIIVIAIGLWNIIGALKVLLFLLHTTK
jgi:hypothetical protein